MTPDRLEPHHAAARHWADTEVDALTESDRRAQILDRLRRPIAPDTAAKAQRTVDHFRDDQCPSC